jgi:hypothetical protein
VLTRPLDDGIVVVGVRKECLVMLRVSVALRERLGEDAARDLETYAEGVSAEWREDVMHAAAERFDARLDALSDRIDIRVATAAAELRVEMADMRAAIRQEMHQGFERIWQAIADLKVSLRHEIASTRVDTLRWSFLFWISEVGVLVSLLAYMLRGVAPR